MSWRRITRKIQRWFRGPPQSARDVVRSYDEYLHLQLDTFLSYESDVAAWVDGQRRFLESVLARLPRSARVLDCACGDGTGLTVLRTMGFEDVTGVELSADKADRARRHGFPVVESDMHHLDSFSSGSFAAIVCSHTLEHAYDPSRVLGEFHRVLAADGELHVVLPFPDTGHRNERAHVGKFALGTDRDDGGEAVERFCTDNGFRVLSKRFETVREPEIWLHLAKAPASQ